MKTRPFLVSILLLCLALAAASAVRSRRNEKSLRVAANAARVAQEGKQRELTAQMTAVEAERARYRGLLTAGTAPGGGAVAPAPVAATAPASPSNSREARIGASATLTEASARAYADDNLLLYGGLLKRLGLSTEQIKRFEDVQLEAQRHTLARAVFAAEHGLSPNSRQVAQLQQDWAKEEKNAYREIFGQNYDTWTQERSDLKSRRVVNGIVEATFSGSGALSGSQADQLTALLIDHQIEDQEGRRGYDWDIILRSASGFLGAEQLDGFKNGVEMHLARQQMTRIQTPSQER